MTSVSYAHVVVESQWNIVFMHSSMYPFIFIQDMGIILDNGCYKCSFTESRKLVLCFLTEFIR